MKRTAYVLLGQIVLAAVMPSSGRADSHFGISAKFPAGWTVENLPHWPMTKYGDVTGDVEVATWSGPEGKAVIMLGCVRRRNDEADEVGAQLRLQAREFKDTWNEDSVALTDVGEISIGRRSWRAIDAQVHANDKLVVTSRIVATIISECVITASLSGSESAFRKQLSAFDLVVAEMKAD